MMILRRFVPLMLLMLLSVSGHAQKLAWHGNLDDALAIARAEGREVIVDFHADWCRYCRLMEETVLEDAMLRHLLQERVRLRIDFERQPEVVARYSVRQLPTFLLLDASGQVKSRLTGYRDAVAFRHWLEQPESVATTTPDAAPAVAWQTLTESEQVAMIPELLERVIADRTSTRTDDEERFLATQAKANPGRFVPLLRDERLAMRIVASNLLINALRRDFGYDPWADPVEREASIERLAEALKEGSP